MDVSLHPQRKKGNSFRRGLIVRYVYSASMSSTLSSVTQVDLAIQPLPPWLLFNSYETLKSERIDRLR